MVTRDSCFRAEAKFICMAQMRRRAESLILADRGLAVTADGSREGLGPWPKDLCDGICGCPKGYPGPIAWLGHEIDRFT
jgi:hypothetical protein